MLRALSQLGGRVPEHAWPRAHRQALQGKVDSPSIHRHPAAHRYKELPRRKQVVTQERSKVLKETENPFGDDEDEPQSPQASSSQPGSHSRNTSLSGPQVTGQVQSFSYLGKDKKKKDKKSKKRKPFDLEAEKDKMKVTIAESSIASTDLMNALQSINREEERISENQVVVQRFETCKHLRRKVLRYVSWTTLPAAPASTQLIRADPPR